MQLRPGESRLVAPRWLPSLAPKAPVLQPGPPHARERIRRPLVTYPLYREDSPMNIIPEKTPGTTEWCRH
jgi:hypothetical protein